MLTTPEPEYTEWYLMEVYPECVDGFHLLCDSGHNPTLCECECHQEVPHARPI